MGVGLVLWRVRIGTYHSKVNNPSRDVNLIKDYTFFFDKIWIKSCSLFVSIVLLILNCGDIEKNPGPSRNNLKIFHWNLNSFSASNFYRKNLIETLNFGMEYDVIAISESALHSNIDNNDLLLDGYISFRRDLPDDRQYGGILVYVKNSIACEDRPDLETIDDQLIIELTIDKKPIFISSNYRKHHHSEEELSLYVENFRTSCENIRSQNPFCTLHVGDFNSHNIAWLNTDITDTAGDKLNEIINDEAMVHLVNQPTHLTSYSNTLIDLAITDQPNIVNSCSVLPSLDPMCHHQINHIELNIHNPPPPSFTRRIGITTELILTR